MSNVKWIVFAVDGSHEDKRRVFATLRAALAQQARWDEEGRVHGLSRITGVQLYKPGVGALDFNA